MTDREEDLAELARLVLSYRALEDRVVSRVDEREASTARTHLRALGAIMGHAACVEAGAPNDVSSDLVASWTKLATMLLARAAENERARVVLASCVRCGQRVELTFACPSCDDTSPGAREMSS